MPYGNNARSKTIRNDKRQHFIKVAMNTKNVIDFLTFDLCSYFRVQFVVMFTLREVPFNLREFLLATYYLQITGQLAYTRKLHAMCPHIKKTTIENMMKYNLVLPDGLKSTGRGAPAKTFIVHPYYFNIIERALKEAAHTIRDTNSKRRRKEKGEEIAPENTAEIDTISSFLDSSEFDFLE
jgi:hypothetical protein